MSLRKEHLRPHAQAHTQKPPFKDTLPDPKLLNKKLSKPLESTFLNSNNSSRTNYDSLSKVAKVVQKLESNIDELKRVCDIPSKQGSLASSKEKEPTSRSRPSKKI